MDVEGLDFNRRIRRGCAYDLRAHHVPDSQEEVLGQLRVDRRRIRRRHRSHDHRHLRDHRGCLDNRRDRLRGQNYCHQVHQQIVQNQAVVLREREALVRALLSP
jgi:hypothetical protein